jgi:fibronectin-binding autotransporter adhesin
MKSKTPIGLIIKPLWAFAVFFAGFIACYGQTRTASVNGNWSSTATWGGNSVPTSANAVTINNGISVTIDVADARCASFSIATGNANGTVTLAGTNMLTVTGALTIATPSTDNRTKTFAVGDGTLNVGSISITGNNNNRISQITIASGTLNCTGNIAFAGAAARAKIVVTVAGVINVGGNFTGGTFTCGSGTVQYNGAAQTIGNYVFNNLTLSGSGTKTESTATVNGILSIEGTAVISGTPTYGAAATLRYRTTNSRTVGAEWLATTAATGGVIIENPSGILTLNAAKVFNANVPLTLGSGSNLATGNFGLTFSGNFINNGGTLTAGSSPVTLTGTATQSIAGFSTTGLVSMTKTGGTATLADDVSGGAFTMNGSGGTLNLGAGLSHTFTGTWTRTNGILNCGSSSITIAGAISGTVGTFTAGTGTVNFSGSAAQTIPALTYYNLILSGTRNTNSITFTSGGTFNVGGNFTAEAYFTSGGYVVTNTTFVFNGTTTQSIDAFTFNNLTVNNSSGVTLAGDVSITGTTNALTFTSGIISTGSNTLGLASGSVVTGAGAGKYISGNLRKGITNGAGITKTFEIGDAINYTPVTLTFSGTVSGSGSIKASTTGSDHPNIGTSSFIPDQTANRYWTLENTNVAGFTSYSAVFTFANPGDLDGGASTATFRTGLFTSGSWSYPVTGTITSTTIQGTAITGFGSFQAGKFQTAPTMGSSFYNSVGITSAVLGATVLSDGGTTLLERGTLWSTSAGVTLADNKLAEGGTQSGAFSHLRTGLPAETRIYFRGYATNSAGSSMSAEASFYTVSEEPATQATGLSFSGIASTQMTISWTPGSGQYSLVVMKAGGPVDAAPSDGVTYTPSIVFGNGSEIGTGNRVVYNSTGSSVTVAGGLSPGTTYHVAVYSYNGTPNFENYLTANPPVGSLQIQAQQSGDFRTIANGTWQTTAIWEYYNGTAWVAASAPPTNSDGNIYVRSPYTIEISASVTVDQTIVEAGAKVVVNVNPSGYYLYLNDGAGTDLFINGTFEYRDDVMQIPAGATVAVGSMGLFQENLTYGGNYPVTIPIINWDTGSTFEMIACNQLPVQAGLNQSFSNFTWNYTGQTVPLNLAGALTTVRGNLTVQSTGSSALQLTDATSMSLVIGNNLDVQGGTLDCSSAAAAVKELLIHGNFLQSGGVFTHTNNSNVTVRFTGPESQFSQTGGTLTNDYINWEVGLGATLALGTNLPVAAGRTLTVNGSLTCPSGIAVTGPGIFILSDNATLKMASPEGITTTGATGNIQTSARTFNTGGHYVYNGTQAQVTGNALPSAVRNLTIDNTAGVQLTAATSVFGILNPLAGSFSTGGNALTLLSTASQTALVDGSGTGGVAGAVTMQRYLSSGYGYKFVSSPFVSATVGEFSDDLDLSAAFPSFYRYDESRSSSGWVSYTGIGGILNPFEGYAAQFGTNTSPFVADLTGELTTGARQLTLYNTNQPYTRGFNLVGNPYPSPINWDAAAGWTRTNIDNAVYFYDAGSADPYTGTFSSYINGVSSDGIAGSIIPAMQGFFVHVTDGGYPVQGTLGINNLARVTSPNPYYHKARQADSLPLIRISAVLAGTGAASDPAVIYFHDRAGSGFDAGLDALKMLNTAEEVPSLFSIGSGDIHLSINSLPWPGNDLVIVPLGISLLTGGIIQLHADTLAFLPPGNHVYLFDAVTGINQDLGLSRNYSVNLPAGEYASRFFLKFSPTILPEKPEISEGFIAVVNQNTVIIKLMLGNDETRVLQVSNILGQIVWRQEVTGSGYCEVSGSFKPGLYVVTSVGSGTRQSQKILISE